MCFALPALVGNVTVISIGSSGVFNIGDVYQIHPIAQVKTYSGAGSFNTGQGLTVTTGPSATNSYDQDQIDQGLFQSF